MALDTEVLDSLRARVAKHRHKLVTADFDETGRTGLYVLDPHKNELVIVSAGSEDLDRNEVEGWCARREQRSPGEPAVRDHVCHVVQTETEASCLERLEAIQGGGYQLFARLHDEPVHENEYALFCDDDLADQAIGTEGLVRMTEEAEQLQRDAEPHVGRPNSAPRGWQKRWQGAAAMVEELIGEIDDGEDAAVVRTARLDSMSGDLQLAVGLSLDRIEAVARMLSHELDDNCVAGLIAEEASRAGEMVDRIRISGQPPLESETSS